MKTNHLAPNALLQLLELRVGAEIVAGLASIPWLNQAPRGDGHTVLVLPGLLANDASTKALRHYLQHLGYKVHGWGQGFNFGPRVGVEEKLETLLADLVQRSGDKVSLVGQSLGGVYSRMLAFRKPDLVRQVITLGSPGTGHPKATNAWKVYEFVSGSTAEDEARWRDVVSQPLVPTTSICSRTDGVVSFSTSNISPSAHTENIEVVSSHIGMGFHPLVLYAVADRLALPKDQWTPFERKGWRSRFYPEG